MKMNRLSVLLFCFLTLPIWSEAQWLTGVQTYYSDDFREWMIYTDEEDVPGELTMRWRSRNDWSEWNYSIGDLSGTIRATFDDDPSQFEIRGNGVTITARRLFANDFREWRITDNETTLIFKTKWGNNTNEWTLRDEKKGTFEMETEWEADPRDWRIEDELDEEISLQMKVAMVFLAVYHASPHE